MIVVSIIIGLGVAELLSGVARILRGELRPYWLHGVWIVNVLLLLVQYCWSLFDLASRDQWVFADLAGLLAPPVILYLVGSLLFPGNDNQPDLEEFYYSKRRPLFALLSFLAVYYEVQNLSLNAADVLQLSGVAILVTLAITPHPRVHAVLSVLYTLGLLVFIATFSFRLGQSSF